MSNTATHPLPSKKDFHRLRARKNKSTAQEEIPEQEGWNPWTYCSHVIDKGTLFISIPALTERYNVLFFIQSQNFNLEAWAVVEWISEWGELAKLLHKRRNCSLTICEIGDFERLPSPLLSHSSNSSWLISDRILRARQIRPSQAAQRAGLLLDGLQ